VNVISSSPYQVDNFCTNLIFENVTLSPEKCRFCLGTGNVTVELGGAETEVSRCINCDGAGSLTCTTCQGSGIQPRYLDRRYGVQSYFPLLNNLIMNKFSHYVNHDNFVI